VQAGAVCRKVMTDLDRGHRLGSLVVHLREAQQRL
jgi:hypothetical protein